MKAAAKAPLADDSEGSGYGTKRGEWVRFWDALCEGDKRGLKRATRFIYLELSLKARKLAGDIVLPVGMSDVDAVHDLLGGDRKEIVLALSDLTRPLDPDDDECRPMVTFTGPASRRILTVHSWAEWNPIDKSSDRVKKYREKKAKKASCNALQVRYTTVSETGCNARVTLLELEEEKREKETPIAPTGAGGVSEPGAETGSGANHPAPASSAPVLAATHHPSALDAAVGADGARDGSLPRLLAESSSTPFLAAPMVDDGETPIPHPAERPSGVVRAPLAERESSSWGELWISVYTKIVRAITGDDGWTFPKKELRTLAQFIDARCGDRSRIPEFIEAELPEFVRATMPRPELWGAFSPGGWTRWRNASRPLVLPSGTFAATGTHGAPNPGPVNPSRRPPPKE